MDEHVWLPLPVVEKEASLSRSVGKDYAEPISSLTALNSEFRAPARHNPALGIMHPAALRHHRAEDFFGRRPEAQGAIAHGQARGLQAAALQTHNTPRQLCFDSLTPSSMARNRFWPRSLTPITTSVHSRSLSPRDARVHPIDPDIDPAVLRQIGLRPVRVLLLPAAFEPAVTGADRFAASPPTSASSAGPISACEIPRRYSHGNTASTEAARRT